MLEGMHLTQLISLWSFHAGLLSRIRVHFADIPAWMIDAFYWKWTLASQQAFHLNTSEAVNRPLKNAVSERT